MRGSSVTLRKYIMPLGGIETVYNKLGFPNNKTANLSLSTKGFYILRLPLGLFKILLSYQTLEYHIPRYKFKMSESNTYFLGFSLFLVCTISTACSWLYNLLIHPLSGFPGPKLAAMTSLYEFWYDVVRDGQYIWEVEKMHDKYGKSYR